MDRLYQLMRQTVGGMRVSGLAIGDPLIDSPDRVLALQEVAKSRLRSVNRQRSHQRVDVPVPRIADRDAVTGHVRTPHTEWLNVMQYQNERNRISVTDVHRTSTTFGGRIDGHFRGTVTSPRWPSSQATSS